MKEDKEQVDRSKFQPDCTAHQRYSQEEQEAKNGKINNFKPNSLCTRFVIPSDKCYSHIYDRTVNDFPEA